MLSACTVHKCAGPCKVHPQNCIAPSHFHMTRSNPLLLPRSRRAPLSTIHHCRSRPSCTQKARRRLAVLTRCQGPLARLDRMHRCAVPARSQPTQPMQARRMQRGRLCFAPLPRLLFQCAETVFSALAVRASRSSIAWLPATWAHGLRLLAREFGLSGRAVDEHGHACASRLIKPVLCFAAGSENVIEEPQAA
jgi:hypothetical protein